VKKIATILGIIISLGIIGGAVYSFDQRKVDKEVYVEFVASTHVQFLEQHRRYIQQRIWEMQARYPNTYPDMIEYQRLVEELRQIDMKIRAFYRRRGG